VEILRELGLLESVERLPGVRVNNVIFGSPKHVEARIDFKRSSRQDFLTGFVIRRQIFDEFLFREAKKAADVWIEGFKVDDIVVEAGQVSGVRGRGQGNVEMEFRGKVVLGADGYRSVVAHKMGVHDPDTRHWMLAYRRYFHNVLGLDNQIELHYVNDVIPGYFWIFPLEDGYANVGIAMLVKSMKRRQVNLKESLDRVIKKPHFQHRFSEATPVEKPVAWNLPVGSKHRKSYGPGFLLLGDAAGLIDPFTGEGIGNAMYSARYAAETVGQACDAGDFTERFLAQYDRRLWGEIGDELRVSARLQKIARFKPLLNFTIEKGARSQTVSDIICGMIANEIPRKRLANPLFYLRLLFG